MFNNIIYFVIVLFIFNIHYPDYTTDKSLPFSVTMLSLTWLIFALCCGLGFRNLQSQLNNSDLTGQNDGRMTARYHGLITRLSALSIFSFALAIYLFDFKYWLQLIPSIERFSVLQGLLSLSLFLLYLGTIWYFAYPLYKAIFRVAITRRSFVASNFRLNLPILFPWILISAIYDLIILSPWAGPSSVFNSVVGQFCFLACFIALLMVFMPGIIRYWWGCKPIKTTEKVKQLEAFLRDKGFKYRHLLRWPVFEGQMMTAGIMGIVPRYRYILIADALLEILSKQELEAVLAHEIGHARYYHLPFYGLFFLGFMVLSFGLSDFCFYLFNAHPFLIKVISGPDFQAANLFFLVLSIPMLITLFVYFRYVMGFFMRNFERQADLYSASVMGTCKHIVNSLERIAYLSGKSRDLPSWHHFSIRERVEYLWQTIRQPELIRLHNRFVAFSFAIYLFCVVGLGYFLNFSTARQHLIYSMVGNNIALNQNLAMLYHEMGKYREAIRTYERIIEMDPRQAVSLNNLAWLLVTASRKELRDERRALDLAKKAVMIERSPVFLDTLAEVYYANGLILKAVGTVEEAISIATENQEYYRNQLEKFLGSSQ
ncbi:MAG: M48 family metalloprotease [Thermodesulfobacteriota bacterium]|nr:M48 family metalloprotease [Thermodesulfobacteriota bacterium]